MTVDAINASIVKRELLIVEYDNKLAAYYKELFEDIEEDRRLFIISDIRAIKKNKKQERLLLKQDKSNKKTLLRHGRI